MISVKLKKKSFPGSKTSGPGRPTRWRALVPPKSYKDGLTGGRGKSERDHSRHFFRVDSQGGFGGGGGCNERLVNGEWITYQGAGGGFKGGSIAFWVDSQCEGGGGGSFSADPNAKFDHHYVEFGYCKIERQMSEN